MMFVSNLKLGCASRNQNVVLVKYALIQCFSFHASKTCGFENNSRKSSDCKPCASNDTKNDNPWPPK